MRRSRSRNAAASLWAMLGTLALTLAGQASAQTLKVGPGQSYATPCAAVADAKANDQIEIAAGTYTDTCSISVAGLTLRGVGGQPKIDLSGTDHPAQYKGIYVIDAADVTIENLELTGAHITDDNGANAAGIRVEAAGLTVRGCNIHDNQNGILGGTTGTITIEHTELFDNGLGDGCNQGGCTHNVYIANIDTLNFRFNWSHHIATDTPDKGHLLKSRAKTNYILYNRLSGEDGFDSYEIDLPNGGLAIVLGNAIEKGKAAGNSNLLSWGEEGASNADKRLFVVNNTFVNDLDSGKFVNASGATLTLHNNLFVGAGSVGASGALSADNLSGVDPLLIDRAHYDYHLMAGSPAIGKAVDPGMADQFSLSAVSEYAHPLLEFARATAHDVGAFEYGNQGSAGAQDGGLSGAADAGAGHGSGTGGRSAVDAGQSGTGGSRAATDGGARAGTGGSGAATGGAAGAGGRKAATDGGTQGKGAHSSSGCGCSVPGLPTNSGRGLLVLGFVMLSLGRRTLIRGKKPACSRPDKRCS